MGQAAEFNLQNKQDFSRDDDSISSSSSSVANDRVRRHHHSRDDIEIGCSDGIRQGRRLPETIHVRLNESYFGKEKTAIYNLLANARQRVASLRLFNPAKNEVVRENEQTWSESVSVVSVSSGHNN